MKHILVGDQIVIAETKLRTIPARMNRRLFEEHVVVYCDSVELALFGFEESCGYVAGSADDLVEAVESLFRVAALYFGRLGVDVEGVIL